MGHLLCLISISETGTNSNSSFASRTTPHGKMIGWLTTSPGNFICSTSYHLPNLHNQVIGSLVLTLLKVRNIFYFWVTQDISQQHWNTGVCLYLIALRLSFLFVHVPPCSIPITINYWLSVHMKYVSNYIG